MTILEALEQVRELKPNQYSDEVLVGWLSELDGRLWQNVFCHYEDGHEAGCPMPYTAEDMERVLLVPHPYTELYVTYLCAKVDYLNAEYERYNNGIILFNAQEQAFMDAYNRGHMPKQDAVITV